MRGRLHLALFPMMLACTEGEFQAAPSGGAGGVSSGGAEATGGGDEMGGAHPTGGAESAGGGGADSVGGGGADPIDGKGGADNRDTTPPEVVSTTPADEDSRVVNETMTITFSEPMDRSSVEAVFPGASFTWTNNGTKVQVATSFPFANTAKVHTITLPTSVKDLAGNELDEPFRISISLAALRTTTIDYISDLSGNHFGGSWFYTGDDSENRVIYGGVSFALGGLPAYSRVLTVRNAKVGTQVTQIDNNPNSSVLGGFSVDHVTFTGRGGIGSATVVEREFHVLFRPGEIDLGEQIIIDVRRQLAKSWQRGDPYFQLRMYPGGSDGDSLRDVFWMRRIADENSSALDPAVPDPDESKRLRLEVEWFE